MQSATSPSLLESMSLQHKAYLSEITRLQCKNQLLQLMERNTKASSVISQATQTDSINSIDMNQQVMMDEESIYEVLRESDDVINRLGVKNKDKENNQEEENDALTLLDCNRSVTAPEGSKSMIFDKVSTEEVVDINKKLCDAVRSLLQELGSTQAEKRQMAVKLQGSGEMIKNSIDEELKFSSLELPPLEVSYPELGVFKISP